VLGHFHQPLIIGNPRMKLAMNLLFGGDSVAESADQSPNPRAQAISPTDAARALARRPKRVRKKWSGFLHGRRTWRGQEIELPDGTPAFLYGALRGEAVWSFHRDRLLGGQGEPFRWGVLHGDLIRLRVDPHAQVLGAMKRGVRERRSEAKAAAVRINGRKPPRPGSRPRGRPKKKPPAPGPTASAWTPIPQL